MPETTFNEKKPDAWSLEREQIMQSRIKDLGLRIEGTYLEGLVEKLYRELEAAGIRLRPRVYLSDEWSCPDGVPVIGIPFYLADKKLARIEDEMMDGIEAETEEEILRYLRHEAGHAFSYAHRLYETEEFVRTFGDYGRPYREDYVPAPFSRDYVRHISGWYAQKHPAIVEWDFSKVKDAPKFATAEAKWDKDSEGFKAPERFPEDIPGPVYKRIQETAVTACKALKIHDYGRVDLRVRPAKEADGWEMFVIEVNPNPYLHKKAEVAMAARKAELSYPDLVERILDLAIKRPR